MSAPRIILASLPSFCQNYQNWCKFDKVLTKTNLHSFLRHGVDDATLSELVQLKQLVTHISTDLADLLSWAAHSGMELNISKTKEMILGQLAVTNLPLLSISSQTNDK